MTSKGHIIFSISVIILIKKIEIITVLSYSNWGHLIVGSLLTCLLPDIDHPQSWLGRKCKFISIPISKFCGHRGITHSFLSVLICFFLLKNKLFLVFPPDIVIVMIISYISHIIADMLTPAGVPLLWPLSWKFRMPILISNKGILKEKVFCLLLFIFSILYPINLEIFYQPLNNLIKKFFHKY